MVEYIEIIFEPKPLNPHSVETRDSTKENFTYIYLLGDILNVAVIKNFVKQENQ